jgi:hypothetical protein
MKFMMKFLAFAYIAFQFALIGAMVWIGYEVYTIGIHDFAMNMWNGTNIK